MTKTRIGVIFGGRSGEHEVSVRSARSVIEAIDLEKYEVVPLAIDKTGKWLSQTESAALLPAETQALLYGGEENDGDRVEHDETQSIALIGDPTYRGLTKLPDRNNEMVVEKLDIVFPVLHGTYGEDGTIQGLFDMAGIPYVGCGVLASSCGMDKVTMKALFRDAGLPMCRYTWFLRRDFEAAPAAAVERVKNEVGFPCFVKPANLGSSVGVSRADDDESLRTAIELAARFDRKIIVEEGLDAREIEVAVIGNDTPEASLPGEYIIFDETAKFLDYEEKYKGTGNNEFVVPAKLDDEMIEEIRELAKIAFKAVDGSGLSRVDFFLRRDNGALLINEINTLPGLTEVSGFPKMWAASGKPFGQVIDELVAFAVERLEDKSRNQTSL